MIRSLELSAPALRSAEVDLMNPHAERGSLCKNPQSAGFRELGGWGTLACTRRVVAHSSCTGTEAPARGAPPDLALCRPSSHCSFTSFKIPFTVDRWSSVLFSWDLGSPLANDEIENGEWEPPICS